MDYFKNYMDHFFHVTPPEYPSIDPKWDIKKKRFDIVDIIGLTNKYFQHEIYDFPDDSNYKRYDFSQLWNNEEIVHKINEIEELTKDPELVKYKDMKILFCLYKKMNFVLPLGILRKIKINEQSSIINDEIIYTLTFFGRDNLEVLQLDMFEIFLTREDIKKNIRYINMSDSTIYKIGNKPKNKPYEDSKSLMANLPKTLRSAFEYTNKIKEANNKKKEAEINSKEQISEMRKLNELKKKLKLYEKEKTRKEKEEEEEKKGGKKTETKQKRNKTGTKQKRNKTRKKFNIIFNEKYIQKNSL